MEKSMQLSKRLEQRLEQRKKTGNLRSLACRSGLDFSSNDYLGLRSDQTLKGLTEAVLSRVKPDLGSSGSRLLSGHNQLCDDLEMKLARKFSSPAALLFNSGYTLNLGLPEFLSEDEDIFLADELVHASVKSGLKLAKGKTYYFRHNQISHLQSKLKRLSPGFKGQVFILVESVYSMDGDLAPLADLVDLARTYHAALIVDEAHGAGVFGPGGVGCVAGQGLEKDVFARVVTFGKAYGSHGAVLLGSELLRQSAINFCGSFIYTTSMTPAHLLALDTMFDYLGTRPDYQENLHHNVEHLKNLTGFLTQKSPIFSFMIPDIHQLNQLARDLDQHGFIVFPVWSPTVRRGTERLRVVLHRYNELSDISNLWERLKPYEHHWQKNICDRH